MLNLSGRPRVLLAAESLATGGGPGSSAELPASFQTYAVSILGARLRASTYGGQSLEFTVTSPNGEIQPVNFMSPIADLSGKGTPIRGAGQLAGWPNFGAGKLQFPNEDFDVTKLPGHGLLRTRTFTLERSPNSDDQGRSNSIVLTSSSTEADRAIWPYSFAVKHEMIISRSEDGKKYNLSNILAYTNTDDVPAPVQGFYHNYLATSDNKRISIENIQGRPYLDLLDGNKEKTETSAPDKVLDGTNAVTRIYRGLESATIIDPGYGRKVTVKNDSSDAQKGDIVLWSPGTWEGPAAGQASKYPFLRPEDSGRFLCLEGGKLKATLLNPGQTSIIAQSIEVVFD